MDAKRRRRRYRLHYMLRKTSDFTLKTKHRIIIVPVGEEENIKSNKYAIALRDEYRYNLQLTI
jgi:hypothetical protein